MHGEGSRIARPLLSPSLRVALNSAETDNNFRRHQGCGGAFVTIPARATRGEKRGLMQFAVMSWYAPVASRVVIALGGMGGECDSESVPAHCDFRMHVCIMNVAIFTCVSRRIVPWQLQ